jgi:hypothetical protein
MFALMLFEGSRGSGEMCDKPPRLRLEPILIPRPLWGVNAHTLVSEECWQKIRRDTFLRDQNRCVICEQQKPLECHEIFSFDDDHGVAVLVRMESRCADCHACNHLGRLQKRNPAAFKRALKYIGTINRIAPPEVVRLAKEAFRVHKTRTRPWDMKVAQDLMLKYPELARLEGHYSAQTVPSARPAENS